MTVRIAALGACFALIVLVAVGGGYIIAQGFTVADFEDTVQSWGAWGIAASIGLMVVHSFVPFPAEFVAIANGMAYGPVWGTAVTWIGAMCGALIAFALARALGRPFVAQMIVKKDWQSIDQWVEQRGGHLAFFGRFVPVISFNLINYAAGLTRMSWWTFALATGVGILPMTVLMVMMGDNIELMSWQAWASLIASAAILWFFVRRSLRASLVGSQGPQTADPAREHGGED